MEKKKFRQSMWLIVFTAFMAVVVVQFSVIWACMTEVLGAVEPFFVGMGIAFVLSMLCNLYVKFLAKVFPKKNYGFHNGIAVALSYISVIVFIIALFSVVIPKLVENVNVFVESLKVYTANLEEWLVGLAQNTDSEIVAEFSLDLRSLFDSLSSYLEKILSDALSAASFAATQVMAVTGNVVTVVVNGVVALVFSIYMLADRKNLCEQCKRILYAYTPKKFADRTSYIATVSNRIFSKFVVGQIMEAFILGGLCALGMLFIQADYALLIGIIVGVTALIPVAGGYIGGGFAFVLLFMVSPMRALVFMVFLLVLQQLEGNLIYPRVVGSSLGLPGLWVVFAVIVGGGLFGLVGALLSVPVVSILYALLWEDRKSVV